MSAPLPLAGLVVLDMSSFIAGPAAAATLADFGAEVIKVEPPGDGDPHRKSFRNPNYPQTEAGINYPWQLDGRHKRSIVLDLKRPSSSAVLDRLMKRADVVIVNFPPSVRRRLGLDWEEVHRINPRLVYCSLTGYGESGPDCDRPGFDITAYFGRSGILDAARYEGTPPGITVPAQGDRATAMTLVAAILFGLRQRDQTGLGSWVGTSLYANGAWANGTVVQGALVGAQLALRPPRDNPRNALINLYLTKDGYWLQLAVAQEERFWSRLCVAIGRPDLVDDARFGTREQRRVHAGALCSALDTAFASRPRSEWIEMLKQAGITFGSVDRATDVLDDEQAQHANVVIETTNPEVPRTVNNPIRLGFAAPRTPARPPVLGEHSREVLRELGFGEEEIHGFVRDGALG